MRVSARRRNLELIADLEQPVAREQVSYPGGSRLDALAFRSEQQPARPAVCWRLVAEQAEAVVGSGQARSRIQIEERQSRQP